MCSILSPSISSYTKDLDVHILDSIEKDITIFSKNADILLCGDFNARIGTNSDYILNDDNKFTLLLYNIAGFFTVSMNNLSGTVEYIP